MHSAGDLVMCLSDFNGHIGRHIDGFIGDHGWHSVGQRNLEGRMFNDSFVWRRNNVCQIHDLRERKRGR